MKLHKIVSITLSVILVSALTGCATSQKTNAELIQDLKSPSRDTRLSAAHTLGQRGKIAVPSLIEASSDPGRGVRYASMWALYYIGTAESINALNTMVTIIEDDLKDPDIQWQETAVELLNAIGTDKAKAAIRRKVL